MHNILKTCEFQNFFTNNKRFEKILVVFPKPEVFLYFVKKKKSKVHPVQALRLCTGRTAHRGNRGIAVLFHDRGTRRGWGVSVTLRPLFTPGKDPVPIVQEVGWAPGSVWTGAENHAPTGIPSPDRPASSQSLYRLRYSAKLDFMPWRFREYTAFRLKV